MPSIDERSRAPRFNASFPVSLSEGAAYYVLDTENVSDRGLCLHSTKVFPVEAELHMVFGRPARGKHPRGASVSEKTDNAGRRLQEFIAEAEEGCSDYLGQGNCTD